MAAATPADAALAAAEARAEEAEARAEAAEAAAEKAAEDAPAKVPTSKMKTAKGTVIHGPKTVIDKMRKQAAGQAKK